MTVLLLMTRCSDYDYDDDAVYAGLENCFEKSLAFYIFKQPQNFQKSNFNVLRLLYL